MNSHFEDIDTYIAQFPPDVQAKLQEIRKAINEILPEAEELISYRMPAFKMKTVLVYFAGYKNHIGFYPTAQGIEAFKHEFTPYKWSKGAVQFPIKKDIPIELIKKIAIFRAQQEVSISK